MDWLGNLEFSDLTRAADLPVGIEDALRGMPMRTAQGRVLIGFPAVRRALRRTPVGFLPAVVLYVPGTACVGERVYAEVARRRSRSCRV